ncbi:MAG: hypothetical protein RL722_2232 [Pseudomonadota bacterium]|jgi:enterochelin esterase-like enzyme
MSSPAHLAHPGSPRLLPQDRLITAASASVNTGRRQLLSALPALPALLASVCPSSWAADAAASAAASASTATLPPSSRLPRVLSGRLERLADVPLGPLGSRHVDVWLPPDYERGRRHRVVWVLDGQSAYDGGWRGRRSSLGVANALGRMLREGRVSDTLIVAPWSEPAAAVLTGEAPRSRASELVPVHLLQALVPSHRAILEARLAPLSASPPVGAEAMLDILVRQLKPLIDQRFRTRPEREHQFILGAGLAGLAALEGLVSQPETFRGAAALSPDWGLLGLAAMPAASSSSSTPVADDVSTAVADLAVAQFLKRLPPAEGHGLYIDHGDQGLDALNTAAHQRLVAGLGQAWPDGPWLEREFGGTAMLETAWAARMHIPLLHLLLLRN